MRILVTARYAVIPEILPVATPEVEPCRTLHILAVHFLKNMTQITSHILDTSRGSPAEGVLTILMQQQNDDWLMLGSASTDADGRIADFTGSIDQLPGGIYKLTFYMSGYYENLQQSCFYPYIEVVFEISGDGQHYHVPLLVNPFGYSTYRGS